MNTETSLSIIPTKNDLPAERRDAAIKLLNALLADLIDLQLQAKQAQWNVKGPNFIALHELFDSVAEEAEGFVDTVAERIAALGGASRGNDRYREQPLYAGSLPSGHYQWTS